MELSKTLTLYFGVITGMIAFVIIAVGSIIIAIRYQKRLLQQQSEIFNKDLRYKEELLVSNIRSVEEERRRIAKDIHDELGGIFSALFLTINQIRTDDPQNLQVILSGKDLINTGINSVRRTAHSIIPEELELFGLNTAIENFLTPIQVSSGIDIEYNNALNKDILTPSQELALYRIMQELVSNTLKHASASAINISLIAQHDYINVHYNDNGKGFDKNTITVNKGLGTKNIESRIILINAQMEISTSPGKGFSCTINIPFQQNKIA